MFGLSVPHLLILAIVVLVLFGKGRISEMMGDFGKGVNSFKKGLAEGDEVKPQAPASQIPPPPPAGQATLNGETVIDSSQNSPQ